MNYIAQPMLQAEMLNKGITSLNQKNNLLYKIYYNWNYMGALIKIALIFLTVLYSTILINNFASIITISNNITVDITASTIEIINSTVTNSLNSSNIGIYLITILKQIVDSSMNIITNGYLIIYALILSTMIYLPIQILLKPMKIHE